MSGQEAKFTRLPVRTLGPGHGLTLEQYRDIPEPERPAPLRGTREQGTPRAAVFVWTDHALCKGQGTVYGNVWMYPGKNPESVVAAAVKLCRACPVRDDCAADARMSSPIWGIRAGKVYGGGYDDEAGTTAVCEICDQVFKAFSTAAKACSGACRLELRRRWDAEYKRLRKERSNKRAANVVTGPNRGANVGENLDEPGARQRPGSDRKPIEEAPMSEIVRDLSTPVKSDRVR